MECGSASHRQRIEEVGGKAPLAKARNLGWYPLKSRTVQGDLHHIRPPGNQLL